MQNVNDMAAIYKNKRQSAHKWQVNSQYLQDLWFHLACRM